MAQISVTDPQTGEESMVESPSMEIHFGGSKQTCVYIDGEQVGLILHLKFEVGTSEVFSEVSLTFPHPDVLAPASEDLKPAIWKNIKRTYPPGVRIFLRDAKGIDKVWCGRE